MNNRNMQRSVQDYVKCSQAPHILLCKQPSRPFTNSKEVKVSPPVVAEVKHRNNSEYILIQGPAVNGSTVLEE